MQSLTMPQMASACSLATALYYLRAQYYGIAIEPWEALPPSTKQRWIDTANDMLLNVAPRPRRLERTA